jgi:hypothetical protein
MTVIEVHSDWVNFSQGILMPMVTIPAYDTKDAIEIFKRYLKRWIKNPDSRSITIRGKIWDVTPDPKTND